MAAYPLINTIMALIAKNKPELAIGKLGALLKQNEKLRELLIQRAVHNEIVKQICSEDFDFGNSTCTKDEINLALSAISTELEEQANNNPVLAQHLMHTTDKEVTDIIQKGKNNIAIKNVTNSNIRITKK